MGSREEEVRQDGCGFVGALFRRWYVYMNVLRLGICDLGTMGGTSWCDSVWEG